MNTENIKNALDSKGFYIFKNYFPPEQIINLQNFWVSFFKETSKSRIKTNVVWNPYLGQKNLVTYSNDNFQSLYRVLDFYWNKSYCPNTKNIILDIANFVQKNLKKIDKNINQFDSNTFGLYASISYYPSNSGYLSSHKDSLKDQDLYHHMIPLTFKGTHYDEGGLYIYDSNNIKVDIDQGLEPGDVIFFNGKFDHGVEKITSSSHEKVGRIQCFGIPVMFQYPEELPNLLDIFKPKIFDIAKYLLRKII